MPYKIPNPHHHYREQRQGAFTAHKHLRHLRHHVTEQKRHNRNGDQRHNRWIQRRTDELGLQGLALFQIVRQPLQHGAKVAAMLACAHDRAVRWRKFARMLHQSRSKRRSAIHFGAQGGDEIALARVI